MSIFDRSFLDPVGRAVIATIEAVISLSTITSLLSLSAALVATWVMQVTTHASGRARLVHLRGWRWRSALAALAIFLMLNALTPFITPDPPWLANLPLVVAIMAFLLAALSRLQILKTGKATERAPGAHEPSLISPLVSPTCRPVSDCGLFASRRRRDDREPRRIHRVRVRRRVGHAGDHARCRVQFEPRSLAQRVTTACLAVALAQRPRRVRHHDAADHHRAAALDSERVA